MDSAERRRELYKALQATCADAPLTTNKLAELLHVSVRTVHYDLDTLSEELEARGQKLCRKARKGVWLEGSLEERTSAGSLALSPKERRDCIILALLERVRSIDELAEELDISRNTMLLDLKNVQETLERRGLVYDSKRGAGIWAHGREQDVRDMFIHIFAKADYDFRQFAKGAGHSAQQPFRHYTEELPVAEM